MMGLVPQPSPSFLACKNGPQSIHCRLPQGVNKILQGRASDRGGQGSGWGGWQPGPRISKLQIQTQDEVMDGWTQRRSLRREKRRRSSLSVNCCRLRLTLSLLLPPEGTLGSLCSSVLRICPAPLCDLAGAGASGLSFSSCPLLQPQAALQTWSAQGLCLHCSLYLEGSPHRSPCASLPLFLGCLLKCHHP